MTDQNNEAHLLTGILCGGKPQLLVIELKGSINSAL